MIEIAALLSLAASPLPDSKDARAVAITEAESALDRLYVARDTIRSEIHDITARRRPLLLDGTPHARKQMAELDKLRESLALDLERLDAAEEALVDRCRKLDAAHRRHQINDFLSEYEELVRTWGSVMLAAVQARGAIAEFRSRMAAAGFESLFGQFPIPHPTFPHHAGQIEIFCSQSIGQARQMTVRPRNADCYPITFTESFPPYRSGETAGFAAATAWKLVEAGVAAFADPRRRPPRPDTEVPK